MSQSSPTGIVRSIGVVSLFSIAQIVLQFLLQTLLADRFGAGQEIDAFNAVITLPSVLTTLLTVAIGYCLIPVLTQQFESNDKTEAWTTAALFVFSMAAFSLAVSLLLSWFSPAIVGLLFGGFNTETAQIASNSLCIVGWQFFFSSTTAILASIHQSQNRFFAPAAAAAIAALLNLILATIWIESGWIASGIYGYAWSVVVSNSVYFMLVLFPIARPLFQNFRWWTSTASTVAIRVWPLLIGGMLLRLDPLIDRIIASDLNEGAIAHLGYAQRFMAALLTIITGSIMTVVFPKLSAKGGATPNSSNVDSGELAEGVRAALCGLHIVVFPIVIGGIGFSNIVVRDLLQRGEFSGSDTLAVATLMQILFPFFMFAGVGDLLSRGVMAKGKTVMISIITTISVGIGGVLKFVAAQQFGVNGIAAATSCYFLLSIVGTGFLFYRLAGRFWDLRLFRECGLSIVAALFACSVAYLVDLAIGQYSTLLAIPLAAGAYFVALYVLGHQTFLEISQQLWRRK